MEEENPLAETRRRFPVFAMVLALSVVLNVTGIWWGLPADYGWAPDEIFPQRVLAGLDSQFAHGWYDRYPPVHYYILSLLYAPFRALNKAKVFDQTPASLDLVLYYLGRLLSVLMAAGCLVLVQRIGREILDRRAALFASLITALLVPFPYYAKTVNLDMPYLFWFLWSLYFFVRIVKTQRSKYYLLFALTAALSICTKDQAYGLYVLAPALVIWADRRAAAAAGERRPVAFFIFKAIFNTRSISMAAAGAVTFILAHNLVFNWSGFIRHIKMIVGPASQDYTMFPASVAGHLKLLMLTFSEIRFCLGWPLLIVCLLGLGLAVLERPKNFGLLLLALFGLSYYIFYIAVIRYNYVRFNLPLGILLAFFGGKALSALDGVRPPWRTVAKTAAVMALAYSFSLAASVDILMVKDSRYAVERWLHAHVPAGSSIGIVGLPNYLPRLDGYAWRCIRPRLSDLEGPAQPDYLMFITLYVRRFPADSMERRFFLDLDKTRPGYHLVYKYQTPLGWLPLRTKSAFSNLALINPEVHVYEKRRSVAGALNPGLTHINKSTDSVAILNALIRTLLLSIRYQQH
jgi:4-amino-4-deoxy-L-arabinose transferase-like glycosyltransferase